MEIKFEGFSEERVIDRIAQTVHEAAEDRIDVAVRGAIKAEIDRAVRDAVLGKIEPLVAEVIADGWQPTDQWGDARGPKVGLKERVSQLIQERGNYEKERRIDVMVKKAIDDAIRGPMEEELKRAREQFRAEVDAVMQAKLRAALAGALGLGGK